MMTSVFPVIFLLQYHVTVQSVMASGTINDINNLKTQLFRNYYREMRPVRNLSDVVEINTIFIVASILDFDEVSGTLTISSGFQLNWMDFRLAWNSTEYGGIVHHGFSSALIWKPSIFMISSADEYEEYGSDKFDARVFSNGTVMFTPGRVVKTTCSVDMTSFPSDSHVCSAIFAPWLYSRSEVKLLPNMSKIDTSLFWPSKEWEIDRTFVAENARYSKYATVISHDIYLRRKPRYFMISLASPVILLCFLNPFVFLLPVSSGERISFAVTIFLSLAVYMSYIGQELMPKVSDPMSGLSHFLLGSICFSCLLIILTVLRLNYVDVQNLYEFPCWLTLFVKTWIYIARCRNRNRIEIKDGVTDDEASVRESQDWIRSTKDDIESVSKFIDKSLFLISEIIILIFEVVSMSVFEVNIGI